MCWGLPFIFDGQSRKYDRGWNILQDIFAYIDSGKMDWMFWIVVIIFLAQAIYRYAKGKMKCPICGAPQCIFVDKFDKSHWFCENCGWDEDKWKEVAIR
jgi:hypothetical protein